MSKEEMVEVILYEDGSYKVQDVDSSYATQRLRGFDGKAGKDFDVYYCPKSKWKKYLIKLLSTKEIDKEIAELKKRKAKIKELKKKILEEIENEV